MISLIGNSLLYISIISLFGALILRNKLKLISFYIGTSSIIIAFSALIIGFITSDFSLKNVFLNSSIILPLIYKISASWASHEGSILLWNSLMSIISVFYIKSIKCSDESKEFGIVIFSFILILFTSFILFTSNPFESFTFMPKQGMGLNPMLQDSALSTHPPLLYLGNVTYIALFASGCLILHNPDETNQILNFAKNFSNFALVTLTLGIALGAWWAYRELGWGGYWFFDAVENISLLPWLSGIALHHFLILSIRNGRFLKWSIFLSLFTFILALYGTFIVRSGIISSIHSFAFSKGRGLYIFSICTTITIVTLTWFLLKYKNIKKPKSPLQLQEILIFIGNILWIVSLFSIIVAISYQIYYSLKTGIDIIIDHGYFISVFIPIFIPILLLAAVSLTTVKTKNYKQNIIIILLSISIICIINLYVNFGYISCAISFSSIYLMIKTSISFVENSACRKYSVFLGHFGFGMLVLSIALNNLLFEEVNFQGKIGDQVERCSMQIKLENIKYSEGSNYYRQIAIFQIQDKHNNIVILKPENRLYKIENRLSQEVDIFSFLSHDLYAVFNKVDKETIHATIYYQPFISFIWLSVLIMVSGFCLSFRKRT